MRAILFAAIAIGALCASTSNAGAPREQLIIVDNSEVCGPARLAYHKRQDAERQAERIARRIEREQGITTRIVVIHPGQFFTTWKRESANPLPVYLNTPR
ncbi:hypothetical protein [Sphingobium sp. YBL2]|uniref:hypothetical protein n=1 Tax=Sphingobium sp. (strain YBL2) TaxID=484429 RepID=UPI000B0B17D6|nr:hypothetical protein [Sphingobium sp. YBL2]